MSKAKDLLQSYNDAKLIKVVQYNLFTQALSNLSLIPGDR